MSRMTAKDVAPNPTTVGASATTQVVTSPFAIAAAGANRLRLDFFVGKVAAATGVTCGMQQSAGHNVWSTTKTTSITASTEKTYTAATTDICTSTTHGFSTGDAVVATSTGTFPTGIEPNTIYYVVNIDADTFYLSKRLSTLVQDRVDVTATGSATNSLTLVRRFSISFNSEVAGDQTYLPLGPTARGYITSGASDSCQVLAVRAVQAD